MAKKAVKKEEKPVESVAPEEEVEKVDEPKEEVYLGKRLIGGKKIVKAALIEEVVVDEEGEETSNPTGFVSVEDEQGSIYKLPVAEYEAL